MKEHAVARSLGILAAVFVCQNTQKVAAQDSVPCERLEMTTTATYGNRLAGNGNSTTTTTEQLIRDGLAKYTPLTLIAIGVPGNILYMAVLRAKPYRKTPSAVYMQALCVFDLNVLLGEGLLLCLSTFFAAMFDSTPFLCRLNFAANLSSTGFTNLTLTAMTVDKLFSLRYPNFAPFTKRTVNVPMIILIISVIPSTFFVFGFLVADVRRTPAGLLQCQLGDEHVAITTNLIYNLSVVIAPQVILAVSNVAIVKTTARDEFWRDEDLTQDKKQKTRDLHVTAIVLFLSWLYVCLTLPDIACVFFWFLYDPSSQAMTYENYKLTITVCKYLSFFNSAATFYAACFTSGKFRRRALRMVQRRFCCGAEQENAVASDPCPASPTITMVSTQELMNNEEVISDVGNTDCTAG